VHKVCFPPKKKRNVFLLKFIRCKLFAIRNLVLAIKLIPIMQPRIGADQRLPIPPRNLEKRSSLLRLSNRTYKEMTKMTLDYFPGHILYFGKAV